MIFRSCHEQTEFPSASIAINVHALKLDDMMLFAILNSMERTRNGVRATVKGTHYTISSAIISLSFDVNRECECRAHMEAAALMKIPKSHSQNRLRIFQLRYTFINQPLLMPSNRILLLFLSFNSLNFTFFPLSPVFNLHNVSTDDVM